MREHTSVLHEEFVADLLFAAKTARSAVRIPVCLCRPQKSGVLQSAQSGTTA